MTCCDCGLSIVLDLGLGRVQGLLQRCIHRHPPTPCAPHSLLPARLLLQGSGLSEGGYVTLGALEVDDLAAVVQYLREEGRPHLIASARVAGGRQAGRQAGRRTRHLPRPHICQLHAHRPAMVCHLRGPPRSILPVGSTSTVGLWGRSMGAVTALLYSQQDPSVAGMVLDSPFSRLVDLMLELASDQQLRIPKPLLKASISGGAGL